MTTDIEYVHGYSPREKDRLCDQANTLTALLHRDTVYPAGCRVLEAGCGVGAQTAILSRNSPMAQFTCIDISPVSVDAARAMAAREGLANVTFQVASIFDLPFEPAQFDHVFVCFVLEHLKEPVEALVHLKAMLKPGGSITVIEGDHGSTYFSPESRTALRTVQSLIYLQAQAGGDALIGRRLYPLLRQAGFRDVAVSPRMVYVDDSKPDLVEGFTRNTFIAMVEGVREQALTGKLMDAASWDRGIADLYETAGPDGVFCYTFFKGVAVR